MMKYCYVTIFVFSLFRFGTSSNTIFRTHEIQDRRGRLVVMAGNLFAWFTAILISIFFVDNIPAIIWFLGICAHALCWASFEYLGKISRNRLTTAFSKDVPQVLIQEGLYKYIRHPFYSVYMTSHFTSALITFHPLVIVNSLLMALIYFYAAHFEEQKFLDSELKSDYRRYKESAGMFLPRWPKKRVIP